MHNPLDMLVFAKIVELLSFSRAARRLGISRSTASKHVTRLERDLGVRLLSRTTRKLGLTDAGRSVYEHCARVAEQVEAAANSVYPFVNRPQGLVRVSAPIAFGRLHLSHAVAEYLVRHPGVSIDLVLSDRLVDLVDERVDIAVTSSPMLQGSLIRRELCPIRWAVCATPSYVCKHGIPKKPEDLRQHNCIFYELPVVRGDTWKFKHNNESHTVQVSGNFKANNSEVVRDATLDGLGIGLLPTFAAWQDIFSGSLVNLLPDWTPLGTFGNSLIIHFIGDRHLPPKIRTLIDFLVQRFRRSPPWARENWKRSSSRR